MDSKGTLLLSMQKHYANHNGSENVTKQTDYNFPHSASSILHIFYTPYIFHTHFPHLMHLSMSSPRGGGGGGSGNPREFDCHVCPQGGDFDHLIFQLRREEEKKTILLTIIFCPGVGIFILFFRKCQNPHPMPNPSPPPP